MQDRRLKISEISNDLGISDERPFHILTVELDMKKFWQHETMDQKRQRMIIFQERLDCFNANQIKQISSIDLLQQMKLVFTIVH